MIAPRPGQVVGEVGIVVHVIVDYGDGPQEPLRVAVQLHDLLPLPPRPESLDGLRFALLLVDGARLGLLFVHREHDAAIDQFLVYLLGRGGQEDHHRAFHDVFMRHQLAAHRVFARAGDF